MSDPATLAPAPCSVQAMAAPIACAAPPIPNELWARIEVELPILTRRTRYPGRKRLPDRQVLTGIVFVLSEGISWQDLPLEIGCGSGMTCRRRLAEWTRLGAWGAVEQLLRAELPHAGAIDWSRASGAPERPTAAEGSAAGACPGSDRRSSPWSPTA